MEYNPTLAIGYTVWFIVSCYYGSKYNWIQCTTLKQRTCRFIVHLPLSLVFVIIIPVVPIILSGMLWLVTFGNATEAILVIARSYVLSGAFLFFYLWIANLYVIIAMNHLYNWRVRYNLV
jgi:hypothetical protein